MRRFQRLVPLLVLAMTSCGYSVGHTSRPFGLGRLMVIPFDEDVPAGISPDLSAELVRLLSTDGVHLTQSSTQADAILSGTVSSASTRPGLTTASEGVAIPGYKLTVRVRARIVDSRGDEVWSKSISVQDEFLDSGAAGSEASLRTESNRRRAIARLSSRIARALHDDLHIAAALAPSLRPVEKRNATP